MRKFPECHPEQGEGSQDLSGTGYRDVTSRWCEPKPAPYFLGLRFLDRLRRSRNDMVQRPAENWHMGSCRSHVGFGLVPSQLNAGSCHCSENVMLSQPQRRSIWSGASSPPPQIPRPSREGLGMTGRCPFSWAVVLVAASLNASSRLRFSG